MSDVNNQKQHTIACRVEEIDRWDDLTDPEQIQVIQSLRAYLDRMEKLGLQRAARRDQGKILASLFQDSNITLKTHLNRNLPDFLLTEFEQLLRDDSPFIVHGYYFEPDDGTYDAAYFWHFNKGDRAFVLHVIDDADQPSGYLRSLREHRSFPVDQRIIAHSEQVEYSMQLNHLFSHAFRRLIDVGMIRSDAPEVLQNPSPLKLDKRSLEHILTLSYDPLRSLSIAVERCDLDAAQMLLSRNGLPEAKHLSRANTDEDETSWVLHILNAPAAASAQLSMIDLFIAHGLSINDHSLAKPMLAILLNSRTTEESALLIRGLQDRGVVFPVDHETQDLIAHMGRPGFRSRQDRATLECALLGSSNASHDTNDPSIAL